MPNGQHHVFLYYSFPTPGLCCFKYWLTKKEPLIQNTQSLQRKFWKQFLKRDKFRTLVFWNGKNYCKLNKKYAGFNQNCCDSNETSVPTWLSSTGNHILNVYALSRKYIGNVEIIRELSCLLVDWISHLNN